MGNKEEHLNCVLTLYKETDTHGSGGGVTIPNNHWERISWKTLLRPVAVNKIRVFPSELKLYGQVFTFMRAHFLFLLKKSNDVFFQVSLSQ